MATAADPRLGSVLAGYRIERLLGRGGMSVVYLAEDTRLGRRVALKLIKPEFAGDERFRERFLGESRVAASLDHPNVIPIYEAGEADGQLYIAMRYVDGTDLRSVVRADGPLEPGLALDLLGQAAGALDLAHERGLVHRDVKPGNVLLAEREGQGRPHVYLSDFGLTKQASTESGLTESGQFVGTADYIAPEQIEHGDVGARSDVYALTAVLVECLTGEPPYRRDSLMSLLWAHVHDPPPRPSELRPELPQALDAVVARGLAKDPGERFPTCGALVEAARAAFGFVPAREGPARRLARRPVLALGALGAAAAVAALALGLLLVGREDAVAEPTVELDAGALQRLDAATGRLVATVPLGRAVGQAAATPEGIWVLDATRRGYWRVDPRSNEVTASGVVAGDPAGIAAGVGAVWISHRQGATATSATVTQVAARSGRVARVVPVSVRQRVPSQDMLAGLAFDPGAGGSPALWASSPFELAVHRLRPRLGSTVATIRTGLTAPRSLAVGLGSVWIVRAYALVRVDPRRNELAATIALPFSPRDVAVGAGRVWLAHGTGDSVWALDPAENRIVDRVPVGDEPVALAAASDGAWVVTRRGRASLVDAAAGRVVRSVEIGGRPVDVVVHGGSVWVAADAAPAGDDGRMSESEYVDALQAITRRTTRLYLDADQPLAQRLTSSLTDEQVRDVHRRFPSAGREAAQIARDGLEELRAFEPPERWAADHAAFVRGLERLQRFYEANADGLERGDARTIEESYVGINTAVVELRRELSENFKALVDVFPIAQY